MNVYLVRAGGTWTLTVEHLGLKELHAQAWPLVEPHLHLVGDQATAGVKHLRDKVVATDHANRRQQPGGEAVVVRGEGVLRVRRDVIQVADLVTAAVVLPAGEDDRARLAGHDR